MNLFSQRNGSHIPLLIRLSLIFCRPNTIASPARQAIILKLEKLRASLGTDKVVGPMTMAYSEPIIIPRITNIVWGRNFSRHILIILTTYTAPDITPQPKNSMEGI